MYYFLILVWHYSIDCNGHKINCKSNVNITLFLNSDKIDTELIDWIELIGYTGWDYKFYGCSKNGCYLHGYDQNIQKDIDSIIKAKKSIVGKFLLDNEHTNMNNTIVSINGDAKFMTKNIWVLMKDDRWVELKKHIDMY